MNEYYIVYDIDSGQEAFRAEGPAGASAIQKLSSNLATIVVPYQAFVSMPLDLTTIKASWSASIDLEADKVRSMFITNTPGQMATYVEKEQEARAVLTDAATPTVFLSAEAAALGITVADLAAQVVAQADQWRPIGARIEAARRKAKVAVEAADNLATLKQATVIDWQAVISPDAEGTPT